MEQYIFEHNIALNFVKCNPFICSRIGINFQLNLTHPTKKIQIRLQSQ